VKLDKIYNIELFHEAFTHKSYIKKDIFENEKINKKAMNIIGNPPNVMPLRNNFYERLEFLGDRILKLTISHYLMIRYPDEDEGFMTRLQTKIENKKSLSVLAKEIGLEKFFIISRQIEAIGGRTSDKILEDCFEAFLGALYLDNGFEVCFRLIVNILETLIDYGEKLYKDCNYKDILLRYYHSNKWGHPKYFEVHHEGPPHKRKYIMAVQKHDVEDYVDVQERAFGFGEGNSKRDGEQKAAKMCLIKYGLLNVDQYTQEDILEVDFEALNKDESDDKSTNIIDTSESNSLERDDEMSITSNEDSSVNNDSETDSDYD
jgi:ribonuclease-3